VLHSRTAILTELDEIKDPCSVANGTPMGLAEMGLIGALDVSDAGAVSIELRLTSPFCHMIGFFKAEAQKRLMALPGITSVSLSADNGLDWSPDMIGAAAQTRRFAMLESRYSTTRSSSV
jgi:metal-sulfur cluster biosynthetic enzyme